MEMDLKISDNIENIITLKSLKGDWDPREDGLKVKVQVHLKKMHNFFDKNDGIAEEDSEIGLAIIATCNETRLRKIHNIGSFGSNCEDQIYTKTISFKGNEIDNLLSFEVVFYLQSISNKLTAAHINNQRGAVLGKFPSQQVRIGGTGSLFPIKDINHKNEPLWELEIQELENLETDVFIEKVCLKLNKAHQSYKYIDVNGAEYNEKLVHEIMFSVTSLILSKIMQTMTDQVISRTNTMSGSVYQFIQYLYQTHEIRFDSPYDMMSSLKVYFDTMEMI